MAGPSGSWKYISQVWNGAPTPEPNEIPPEEPPVTVIVVSLRRR
jgi:hypothetical protein